MELNGFKWIWLQFLLFKSIDYKKKVPAIM